MNTSSPAPKPVLLVEDSKVQAMLAGAMVEQTGGLELAATAVDGEDALAYLRGEPPHAGAPRPALVLLEIQMPKLSGLEVLEAMRDSAELCTIPAVVLTSSDKDVAAAAALAHPVSTHVEKPLTEEKLGRIVQFFQSHWDTSADG